VETQKRDVFLALFSAMLPRDLIEILNGEPHMPIIAWFKSFRSAITRNDP
jgi:hypothetical protein